VARTTSPPAGDDERARVKKSLGLEGQEYIGFLGTLEPRKNVPNLVRGWTKAVADMPNPPALVLAGGKGWDEDIDPALASVIEAPGVTDVLINGGQAWVDRGGGLVRVDVGIRNEADARRTAIRMASACGVRLDDASPIADGTLPGGVRLHAVLAPISDSGTLISLRVLGTHHLGVTHLEARGTLPGMIGPLVRALIRARSNALISGATGSGKTTLLSAALSLVPTGERIICIEEVPELAPSHPHCVHLLERAPNVEGQGAVTLTDLVRAAMRMRPHRLAHSSQILKSPAMTMRFSRNRTHDRA